MSHVPHAATNIPAPDRSVDIRNGGQLLALSGNLLGC